MYGSGDGRIEMDFEVDVFLLGLWFYYLDGGFDELVQAPRFKPLDIDSFLLFQPGQGQKIVDDGTQAFGMMPRNLVRSSSFSAAP